MPNTEKFVTICRLKALLDSYGAAPQCWPDEERAAATALIETSPAARILVAEAAALDALLDKIPEPEVSAALTSRVRSMAFQVNKAKSGGMFSRLAAFLRPDSRLGWQGAVAMAGILGMVAGIGLSPLVVDRAGPAPSTAAAPAVTNVAAVTVPDTVETGTASLSPNVNAISLTGDDMAGASTDEAESQSDVGEFTVAGVPLY